MTDPAPSAPTSAPTLLRWLARWRDLDAGQRGFLLQSLLWLPLIRTALRLTGVQRTRHWLERRFPETGIAPVDAVAIAHAESVAQLVDIAGRRGLIRATCLPQALLVYSRLRRDGYRPLLQIGVRKQQGRIDAHAWVALGGVALGQTALVHQPFAGLQAVADHTDPE